MRTCFGLAALPMLAPIALALCAAPLGACAGDAGGGNPSAESTATQLLAMSDEDVPEQLTPAQTESSVLVEGAQLHGANGLIIGPDGLLYNASALGSAISALNPSTGAIVNQFGLSDGVVTPDDLRFGPDGSLYWVSILTGNVVRRTPSGALTQQLVHQGVDGFTFTRDGKRLFTATDFFGDTLYELDPELVKPPRPIASNWGFLNGMEFGADGRLYAPVWTQHKVVSIDVDSCCPLGTDNPYEDCDVRTVADDFFIPSAVKFDPRERLFATDQNGNVVRIDVATGTTEVIKTFPDEPQLDNLAFDTKGDLFVSSGADGFIVQIDPSNPSCVTTLLQGGIILPAGLTVVGSGSDESLYVADCFTLRNFDASTGALLDEDRSFAAVSALQAPATVSPDGSALLLTSWFGSAVQDWDPATETVVDSLTDLAGPLNAIPFQGDIVVAELCSTRAVPCARTALPPPGLVTPGAGRVVRQTRPLSTGTVTTLATMNVPSGLAAVDGDLWATDFANGTLLHLVAGGVTLSPPRRVAAGLEQPKGIAVDSLGRLLVVETGKRRLLRIDPSTGDISVVRSNLSVGLPAPPGAPPAPPTFAMSSVAVGPSGAIYVSGDEGNLIYKF
jgi:sugar lactone lactonase YvrE